MFSVCRRAVSLEAPVDPEISSLIKETLSNRIRPTGKVGHTVMLGRAPMKKPSIIYECVSHFTTVLSSTNRANTLTTASCSRAICSSNSSSGS